MDQSYLFLWLECNKHKSKIVIELMNINVELVYPIRLNVVFFFKEPVLLLHKVLDPNILAANIPIFAFFRKDK